MELISTIDVTVNCIGWSRLCPAAERLARKAAQVSLVDGLAASGVAPTAPVELGVTLADADEQQRLNRDYRGQDTPTNVLAFPAWKPGASVPPGAPMLLGDVVLAFEMVAREATEQKKALGDHIRHLVVHGVLHLLGFDHLTVIDAERMETLETSILAKLGVADPYHDAVAPPDALRVDYE
jgi:probable rRNA maturation factor